MADRAAIEKHFDGDAVLFAAFKAMSVAQFEADVAAGNAAVAAGDAAALRRIAHDVKSVLMLLDDDGGAAQARALESACGAPSPPSAEACQALWAPLRRTLLRAR